MYGRHFDSMYKGSMIGAGAATFAVMGYIIATRRRGWVELNPALLAFTLGETEGVINEAIGKLCSPDAKSRSKKEGGRRLVKEGEYLYRVVNAEEYDRVGKELDRLEKDRERKAEEREAEKVSGKKEESEKEVGLPKEAAFWNLNRGGLAEVQSFSSARERHLVARRGDAYWVANYEAAVLRLGKSDFCQGKNERGWRADFGWVIERPDTVAKIMEGKYDNRTKNTKANPRNVGVMLGPTVYDGEAARRKLERQKLEDENWGEPKTEGT